MITLEQWREFADAVEAHIRDYTIPQYGDYPHDQMSTFTDEDIRTSINRYENRRGKGARGIEEEMRDCLKIAHYRQCLHYREISRVDGWREYAVELRKGNGRNCTIENACAHWHKLKQQVNQSAFGESTITEGKIQDGAVCNFDWSKWEQKPGKIYRMYPYRYQGRPTLPVARVKIQRAHPDAIMPEYKSEGAAGFDLASCEDVTILPFERALVNTGLKMEIPIGHEVSIRPRSGLALKGPLLMPNSPGTIDSDYRGEVGMIFLNLSDKPVVIHKGERVAQGVLGPVTRALWNETDDLERTDRGENGFGSTGVR